jgi:ABC-type lipoprotein release transport system permease subunit
MLSRSAHRQKEMATRQALGASRARIARQLIVESVVLSITGGGLGVIVTIWGVHALVQLISNGSAADFGFEVVLDWRVFAFTSAVTFATGVRAWTSRPLSKKARSLSLRRPAKVCVFVSATRSWRYRSLFPSSCLSAQDC